MIKLKNIKLLGGKVINKNLDSDQKKFKDIGRM